ncbi:MAG: AAA family ATPase [Alphaproteobacteria bacterium]
MNAPIEKIPELLATEFKLLWEAHRLVGLSGYMCLYSMPEQVPFRSKTSGIQYWFDEAGTEAAIQEILRHYNNGQLPNTTLILNPIIHTKHTDGNYTPIGSGIIWCTALSLGVDVLKEESAQRIWELGALASMFHRGDNDRSGLKVIAFCDEAQKVSDDGRTIVGCKQLYDITDVQSQPYAHCYLLSGLSYLTNNGLFQHADIRQLFPKNTLQNTAESCKKIAKDSAIHVQKILDAAYCWDAYERYHSLYQKFGTNPEDVERNLNFFNLVARDVELFDATGPMRTEADDMFEFLVPGLIPKGSVTMVAGSGGTGKSSLVHQLAVMVATDYESGEEAPRWLGQRVSIEKSKGITIYFSGEDGPPILNARAAIFDPKGRGRRLMFQRADFGEGVTFAQHLKRLQKVPDVPLLIIDPVRKFLSGDEDDSAAVSDFFEAIEEFAIRKNTAVVILHHLQKSSYPRTARELLDALRGSQVFIDRPRVVIGLFRDGPHMIAGLAKNNIPPNLGMVQEERVFARDPKKLSLVWLPGTAGVRNAVLTAEELEKLAQEAQKQGR